MAIARVATKRSESLDDLADQFLACRDKGHRWMHLNDQVTATTGKKIREVSRWWQCPSCTTEQEEVFEIPSCTIKRRKYHYPDGYLLIAGAFEGRRVNVRDVRRTVFHRSGIKF